MPDTPPILPYATPERPSASKLAIPILLGLFQFPWLAFFLYSALGWNGPKNLVDDSLAFLLITTPSIAASIAGYRIWQYHRRKTRLLGPMIGCLFIFVISLLIVGWMFYNWVTEVLLDPNGQWYFP